jgi:hypothetical protein
MSIVIKIRVVLLLPMLFSAYLGFSGCQSMKDNLQNWQVVFKHKDIGTARTILHFEMQEDIFIAYTRKRADKDILGGWTSFLGRTFTKSLKEGCLLRIENGRWKQSGDTTILNGILVSPLGNSYFEGFIVKDQLFAYVKNKISDTIGYFSGIPNAAVLPMENYPVLLDSAISVTQNLIFNPQFLIGTEWQSFVAEMHKVAPKIKDDLEMVFAFFYYARKLPFSHFALMRLDEIKNENDKTEYAQRVFLNELLPNTVYLKITSFDGSVQEIDSIFNILSKKEYANLIVDLRNNTGGNIEAGMTFARHLVQIPVYGGLFLTQKYFRKHSHLPSIDDYTRFEHFSEANYRLLTEGIHKTEGICLKIYPQQPVFSGKTFILTNKNTASTCEPIVYGLRYQKVAKIIGEQTAGAMLNGEIFYLGKGFSLVIPTADYYTSNGYRIDRLGVKPDIETSSEKALQYVMDHLIN